MDLAKFASLLYNKALYLPSPVKFNDPWEGYAPKSLFKEQARNELKMLDDIKRNRELAISKKQYVTPYHPEYSVHITRCDDEINLCDQAIDWIENGYHCLIKKEIQKYGVSCWHKSEYESEAMWKTYTDLGKGVAIESTIEKLKYSIVPDTELIFDDVVYYAPEDETVDIQHYKKDCLFFKRESFDYEKEYRVLIELNEEEKGVGTLVNCDLERLIRNIHVSPYYETYMVEVIKDICRDKIQNFETLVRHSTLLDKPDYSLRELAL